MIQRPQPFLGSEALADGRLNRHALRAHHRVLYPDVYLPHGAPPTLSQLTVAAWLWSRRQATIAGVAAAAWHGTRWIDDDIPIELVHTNPRAPPGVITRRETLLDDETLPDAKMQTGGRMRVTVPIRTAFDIGRHQPLRQAVARLDALARATKLQVDDVSTLARRHPRSPGRRQLERALVLVDPGAESPRETYLRLLLTEAGLAPQRTQIPVPTGDVTYYLDMGWPAYLVAVEYDGKQHLLDPKQWRWDIIRQETLARLGWTVIRVVAADEAASIVHRVRRALDHRGYPATSLSVRSRR